MGSEEIKELIERTEIGDRVSFRTDTTVRGVTRSLEVVGEVLGVYPLLESITVKPETIQVLCHGEKKPYKGEFPEVIAPNYNKVSDYWIIR